MTTSEQPSCPLKLRIVQADACPSLSGRTMLDFHIGCDDNEHIFIRIVRTTGNGFFSKEWIRYDSVAPLLVNPITAYSLRTLFQGKSVNTAGFLLAVVKHLGLVQAVPEALRGYQVTENPSFEVHTKKLIADGVDLPESVPGVTVKKIGAKGKGAKRKVD